jgi:hypothetical protein
VAEHQGSSRLQSSAQERLDIPSQVGSHKKLTHPNYGNYTWAFHDNEEIGPAMLARVAKKTGLEPSDL